MIPAIDILCRYLWAVIDIAEKAYWFIWRNVQRQRFLTCGVALDLGRHSFFSNRTICIGDHVSIGRNCHFESALSRIIIGNHVMFGPGVRIFGGNHRTDIVGRLMRDITLDEKRPEDDIDVVIEDDVWVGGGVAILNGVTIGEGSVIGAGAVIAKSVPPYTVVVGNGPRRSWMRFNADQVREHRTGLSRGARSGER